MDIRKIKKLIELLESSGVAEIEVREGEESVRISRPRSQPASPPVAPPPAAPAAPTAETKGPEEDGHVVRSPLVGIYYVAPQPDQPPYVELGQTVGKGDVLCIIEAMKVMNHIETTVAGSIARIFVENGEPVEYGQPLFLIR